MQLMIDLCGQYVKKEDLLSPELWGKLGDAMRNSEINETETDALKSLTEIVYLSLALASVMNIPLPEAIVEMHRANMTSEESPEKYRGPMDLKTILVRYRDGRLRRQISPSTVDLLNRLEEKLNV